MNPGARRPALLPPSGVPRRAPVHPGRFLARQFLQPLALTQGEAAARLGVSRRRVNELLSGRRGMSPDTAIRCALAFGLPAGYWLALQAAWDSFHAWKSLRGAWRGASH
ncbi:MAG TPA: HigA family addiction module antitoxin [Methylibium sp.]|nr:HigA family addiction module antitoxin [Methylibium sp.]